VDHRAERDVSHGPEVARILRRGGLLAIGQGTINTEAVLHEEQSGNVIAEVSAPTSISFEATGWVA